MVSADLKTPLHAQVPIPQTEILGKYPDTEAFRKLQNFQRLMMRQDGKYVWQKLPLDRTLYKITVGLCGIGLLYMAGTCFEMAMPKNKK